jgi:hypothetical protein
MPEPKGRYDYTQAYYLVALSGLHLFLGGLLAIACFFGVVRGWFAVPLLLAPVAHVAGTLVEPPWSEVLFVAPSVVILLAGSLVLLGIGRRSIGDPSP